MTFTPAVPLGDDAPLCPGPRPEMRSPKSPMGADACDTHMHICGPASRYPYDAKRIYTPPDALVADYIKLMKALGLARAVLVQPSIYGADNRAMLDAMVALDAAGVPNRGVAVVDFDVSDAELAELNRLGIRGLRFNLVDVADPSKGLPLAQIRRLAERIADMGWHVEFLAHVDDYPDLARMFGDFPTEIVFGHTGYLRIGRTTDDPGFQAMLELARAGKCWIKLTGPYRISAADLPYGDAGDFARAAVAAAPGRVIWGSDWPHVKISKPMPHDADMCDYFFDWVADETSRRKILVDNPSQLYFF
ncbi:MAG: amidohydrolase family protein [Rhodospirillales bacterium]|nr:amidohydrolase family protein [Rhodospirillales bacterium]